MTDELDIDLLEYEMERIVKQKDAEIRRLQTEIDELEARCNRCVKEAKNCEGRLIQLREMRETVETECHKELLRLHQKIQDAKRMRK